MIKKITTTVLLLFLVINTYAKEPIRVACIGNSITYGATIENRELNSYPAQLQRMLGDGYSVGNFGKSGATLLNKGHRPYTQQVEYQQALEFAGDFVIIHLGVNDTDPRNWVNYRDEFIGDYIDLINSFKEVNHKARIMIARMTPIGSQHPRFNSGTKIWHTEIQQAIEVVARVAKVELIDFFEPLYPYRHLLPDAIHPNQEGAEILARISFQAITGDYGGLKLPILYTDNMVLQRNTPLTIAGTSNAGDKITVSINSQKRSATTDFNGKWSVTLEPMTAGGPYEFQISTKTKTKLFKNVLIGEVWLCSGQSNMAWRVNQSKSSNHDNVLTSDTQLRLFDMRTDVNIGATEWDVSTIASINNLEFYKPTSWTEANTASIKQFSAIAYHFGEMLRDSLDVPIGLICNAIGGSNIESWIDRHTLESDFPLILSNWTNNDFIQLWVRERSAMHLKNSTTKIKRHPYEPAYLYETGIKPLEKFPIKGVIWYQGESNAHNIEAHEELFHLLVKSWRSNWGNAQMPLYYVQLSSLNRPSWCWFRDSQRRLMEDIPHTGMAVSSDKGDSLDVHPKVKDKIGQRLAYWALNKTYNSPTTPSGPLLSRVESIADGVLVIFDYGDNLTTSHGEKPSTFEVAEFDGVFYSAEAEISGNSIKLSSDKVKNIRYIRYGWQPFTRANLINGSQLPASTFRYDLHSPNTEN